MSNYTIVDKDKAAAWVINTSDSRIPDYVRHAENPGTEMVVLEPGVPTKIVMSDYLKGQPVIRRIKDPTQTDAIEYVDDAEAEAAAPAAGAKK